METTDSDYGPASPELAFFAQRLRVLEALLRRRIDGNAPAVRIYDAEQPLRPELDGDDPDHPAILFLAAKLGLSAFDVDVLCLVVGAHVDHDFRGLVAKAGGPSGYVTEALALAVLLPSLDWRLEQRGRLGDRGPLVSGGFLRPRGGGARDAALLPTRRGLALVQGRHLLADLPLFANVLHGSPSTLVSMPDPGEVAATLRDPDGPRVALVSGGPGAGKTTWAVALAALLGPKYLELDMAVAARQVDPAELPVVVAELVDDAGLIGLPVLIDNVALGRVGPEVIERVGAAVVATDVTVIVVSEDLNACSKLLRKTNLLSLSLNANSGERGGMAKPRAVVDTPDLLTWAVRRG